MIDFNKELKANGLSSSTRIWEEADGSVTREYHEHPETHEIVIVDTWYVPEGEDDVAHDFEVIAVISKEESEELKDYISVLKLDEEEFNTVKKYIEKDKKNIASEIIRINKMIK